MDNNIPKVSVLMGIYNCSSMLEDCVDSIINQTYDNWELIMCDDGSSDETYQIALNLYKKFPDKIKLLKNDKNYGLGYSLNRCLEIAEGELLARQDADDYSTPERFEKQVESLQKNEHHGWVSTATEIFDNKYIRGVRKNIQEPTKYHLTRGSQFCHAATMFRKEVLKSVSGYHVSWYTKRGQDYDLWMRLYGKGYRGYNMPDVLYRVREDRNTYKRRKYEDRIKEVFLRFHGYRCMKIPIWSYVLMFKPIAIGLIPKTIMKIIQESRIKENSLKV